MYINEHFIFFYQHALTLLQDFVCPLLGMFRTIDIFTSFVFFPSVNAYWYFFIQTMGSVLSTWLCFLCNLWRFPHNQHTYKTGNKIMKNLHNPYFIFIYFLSSQSSNETIKQSIHIEWTLCRMLRTMTTFARFVFFAFIGHICWLGMFCCLGNLKGWPGGRLLSRFCLGWGRYLDVWTPSLVQILHKQKTSLSFITVTIHLTNIILQYQYMHTNKTLKKTSKNTDIHSVQHGEEVLVNTGLILRIELCAEQRHLSDEEG